MTRFPSLPGFRKRFASRRGRGQMRSVQERIQRAGAHPNIASVRAKSQRHRKSTADQWNQ